MRKICVSIIGGFLAFSAFGVGENVPTSKSYIDSALVEKQDTIERTTGASRALTNTGTAGEYGTKDIYDSTGEYAAQQNALVDAQTMNTAVQNAINAEFVCISWVDDDPTKDCLLMEIRGVTATGATTLPSGYTALEYIESTGTQYIDTGVKVNNNYGTQFDFQYTNTNTDEQILYGSLNPNVISYRTGGNNTRFAFAHKIGTGANCSTTNFTLTERHLGAVNYMNNGLATIDGNTVCNIPSATFASLSNFYLFTASEWWLTGGAYHNSTARIYNFKLSENTSIAHNYIPARRDSDDEIGMYDTVTNTFFTNAGTGEFIAGPVVNLYLPSGD